MRLGILSENAIITLKTNQSIVATLINNNQDNEWLKDFLHDENPFKQSKIFIEGCELDMSAADASKTDFENAKRIFESLKNIPESIACDERLWMSLTFGQLYPYMKYRYDLKIKTTDIQNRWLMSEVAEIRKRLFRQGISMLWWYAYLTYDETRSDHYALTKFAFEHKDFLISIYSRNFSNSKDIRIALINALKEFSEQGNNISDKAIYNGIVKYVSFLGGAYILDLFSKEELHNKIMKQLYILKAENEQTNSPQKFAL